MRSLERDRRSRMALQACVDALQGKNLAAGAAWRNFPQWPLSPSEACAEFELCQRPRTRRPPDLPPVRRQGGDRTGGCNWTSWAGGDLE